MLKVGLSVVGPALTAVGAGLLAYDVLRGPARQRRKLRLAERLDAAEARREDTTQSLVETKRERTVGEQKTEMAQVDERRDRSVQRAEATDERAGERDRARTYVLAVWGLCLVMTGGVAETVAAILAATDL